MNRSRIIGAMCACILSSPAFNAHAIMLHTTDFIADASRTNFNGFEQIPNDGNPLGPLYSGGSGPYTEDGITVEQINGDPGDSIWLGLWAYEGNYSWYPNGGDQGYTRITKADGSDFNNFGFYASIGSPNPSFILYDLLLGGISIFSGSTPFIGSTGDHNYIGFSGGGFDTVHIRHSDFNDPFYSGSGNGLALDAIELSSVPLPGSAWLTGSGLLALIGLGKRKLATDPAY